MLKLILYICLCNILSLIHSNGQSLQYDADLDRMIREKYQDTNENLYLKFTDDDRADGIPKLISSPRIVDRSMRKVHQKLDKNLYSRNIDSNGIDEELKFDYNRPEANNKNKGNSFRKLGNI